MRTTQDETNFTNMMGYFIQALPEGDAKEDFKNGFRKFAAIMRRRAARHKAEEAQLKSELDQTDWRE